MSTDVHENTTADPGQDELELLVNETAAEGQPPRADLPDGAVLVSLYDPKGETVVHEFAVLHPEDWPSSANEDPEMGYFYSWAVKVLATDEDKAMWRALDPTNRQSRRFVHEWQRVVGQDPKDGAASNGSSNGTRRR